MTKNETQQRSIWALASAGIYVAAALAFLIGMFRLNVLPGTYFYGLIGGIILISIPILWGLIRKKKSKGKILLALLALLLAAGMAAAFVYVQSTLSFMEKVTEKEQTHNFYAVVREESKYQELKDIKGETVSVLNVEDETYEKAKKQLLDSVKVDFKKVDAIDKLAESLIDKETDVIFLNSAYYELALEEIDGFTEDTTRILQSYDVTKKEEVKKKATNVTKDAFHVYISGIDTTGSITNISRSDVNMVMTVNPVTKSILLTSIPRDYHVKLASFGAYDKLTHSGIYGINETVSTVENLLDIDIEHYVKVNFTTVTKLVDALGGISIQSEYNFSAGGHQFVVGENYVDGDAALAFARERYSFSSGDNQRVRNQQAVITGIINKATSSTAILTSYTDLLAALEDNMETSFSSKEITSLVKMQLGDMSGWTITRCSLSGYGNSTSVYSMPNSIVYVMDPDQTSIDIAKSKIAEVMKME